MRLTELPDLKGLGPLFFAKKLSHGKCAGASDGPVRLERISQNAGDFAEVPMEVPMTDGNALEQLRRILIERWNKIQSQAGESGLENELRAVERALAKMATGKFGTCERCKEDFPFKSLLAQPEARLCARCQATQEAQESDAGVRWNEAFFRPF